MGFSSRKLLSVITLSLIALNIYVATIPEFPRWVIILFGGLAIICQIIKDQLVDATITKKVQEVQKP